MAVLRRLACASTNLCKEGKRDECRAILVLPVPSSGSRVCGPETIAVLLVISSLAHAQDSSTGNVSGTVTGPRGASVSGADLTITNKVTGQSAHTTTSPGGHLRGSRLASRTICSARGGERISARRPSDQNPGGRDRDRRRQAAAGGRTFGQTGGYRIPGNTRRRRHAQLEQIPDRSRVSGSDPA